MEINTDLGSHALNFSISHITKFMYQGEITFFDLSKAFDTIDHKKLLQYCIN